MSFWDDIFSWTNKPKKQIIDVNINSKNAVWLLNEELTRMHKLLLEPKLNTTANVQLFWKKIEEFHKKMEELIDKTPDIDTQKQISEIQNRLIEETVLGKENT